MRIENFAKTFFFLAAQFAAVAALAQKPELSFAEMRAAFQQLNYAAAKTAGESALRDWRRLSPQNVVEIHQVLGIIAYSEGSFFEAKTQFEAALSLDPNLRLDSLYVSPKIQQFLREVRDHLSANNGLSRGSTRYLIAPDPRPQAALRSLLFPGLGQIQKEQHGKGRLMIAAAGAGLLATGVLHLRRESARENYLSAQTVARTTAMYNRYNFFNRARNGAALLTTGVWLYSFFDALTRMPNQPQPRIGFLPSAEGMAIVPALSWQVTF